MGRYLCRTSMVCCAFRELWNLSYYWYAWIHSYCHILPLRLHKRRPEFSHSFSGIPIVFTHTLKPVTLLSLPNGARSGGMLVDRTSMRDGVDASLLLPVYSASVLPSLLIAGAKRLQAIDTFPFHGLKVSNVVLHN